jgi:hypothetical protein
MELMLADGTRIETTPSYAPAVEDLL